MFRKPTKKFNALGSLEAAAVFNQKSECGLMCVWMCVLIFMRM